MTTSTTTTSPTQANYFVRHWRGELALPISYWVNGVVIGILLAVLSIATVYLGRALGRRTGIVLAATLMVFFLLDIAHLAWGGVGVWRSSTNYQRAGRPAVWAILAKIAVVLGAIRLVINLFGEHGISLILRLLKM